MSLVETVENTCIQLGFDRTYWIAYSGGLDSHVLLHLFSRLRAVYPIKLAAIHINHSLSVNASRWAKHCENICDCLQVEFTQKIVNAKAALGESPEETARQRRYEIFADLLAPGDILLTAHQQDDQAETLLLQLLRGAGPKGLASMPVSKILGKGTHIRPLLDYTRDDLKYYAEKNQLKWIEDESNSNRNFARNFLRHDILPLLKQRWPSVSNTLSRVASHSAEVQQLVTSIAKQDLAAVQGPIPEALSVKKLLTLDDVRQRHVLRAWLEVLHLPLPSVAKIKHIQRDFLHVNSDKSPHMAWSDIELRRYRDILYVMRRLVAHDMKQNVSWDCQQPLILPHVGTLRAVPTTGQGLRVNAQSVSVRFRQGGERLRLPGRNCHHELKKLLQEYDVPPWQRERIPLIYIGDQLAAAVGFFIAADYVVQAGQEGYSLFLV